MHLRYALLALLAEGEAHGYALFKRFTARLGPFWHPNIGQVYQLLRQLERRALVHHRLDGGARRPRRVFRLTARGARALDTWLTRRPGWPPPMRAEILVRLLAAERAGTHALHQQIDRQEAEYRRYLALVREEAERGAPGLARRLADEAAIVHAQAQLDWLVRCRTMVRPETSSRGAAEGEAEASGPLCERRAAAGVAGAANASPTVAHGNDRVYTTSPRVRAGGAGRARLGAPASPAAARR